MLADEELKRDAPDRLSSMDFSSADGPESILEIE
jgi:hypothetical protein